VNVEHRANKVHRVLEVTMETPDPRAAPAKLDHQDRLDHPDLPVLQDQGEITDNRDHKDREARLVLQAYLGLQEA
jgi:hypothetical protein